MIDVEGVTKRFGQVYALREASLHVREGEIFGLVGPNGAGKSTLMLILATLMLPDNGKVRVGEWDVVQHPMEVRRLIGYMPDFFGVYDHLTVTEYLQFYADCYGIDQKQAQKMIPDLLQRVRLQDKAEEYVDDLSRGMKQRLGLARTLIHDPKLLILDEPASGLDPRARVELREILKELRALGKTILISSHILPELEDMCDSIGVMSGGRIVQSGTVAEIQESFGGRQLQIKLLSGAQQVAAWLNAQYGLQAEVLDEQRLSCAIAGGEEEQVSLVRGLVEAGFPLMQVWEEAQDLEELFLSITQQEVHRRA